MIAVVFDQNVVISGQRRQVGDAARPVLVVHAADLCFGWTLDGQVQTPWDRQTDGQGAFKSGCFHGFTKIKLLFTVASASTAVRRPALLLLLQLTYLQRRHL